MMHFAGLGPDAGAADSAADEGDNGEAPAHGEDASGPVEAAADVGQMPVMPFPELIVNVTETGANGRQTSRFLKLNMLLVFDDTQDGADRLVSREIYLRDTFQDFLRQLEVADIRGSQGLAMIKTELLRRARAVGHTDAPVEILIADMVVQ
ncbi:flagellar FliL protein [Loktanella atrilutea]|uniref:Flagellar protein FliL n=1 Tax=Loktanella atrilutea TaxID=366533 RepID=A0A1M5C6G0_LOKAT|nr:flagellar basal body-associated FliL family protein [Loktanella atrilutea]SHF50305.1 flagellar FliL protein [Loktanella atrilutea]